MNWSALSEAPGRESAARRVLWTRRVFEGAGARPGVLSTGISILAVSDGPIMHLGTNVTARLFRRVLLAFEVCPAADFPASNW